MKRLLQGYIAGVCSAVGVCVLIYGLIGGFSKLERSYQKIRYGMVRTEVTQIMGSAGERSSEFRLAQPAGYEMEYAVASKVGAAYFVSWNESDTTYTVAFDSADRVIYKAKGST